MSLTLATWNINSVRIRLHHIQRFVETHAPDIICLQETKVEDHLFPEAELRAMGFEHQAFTGEKSYNGVAILSKVPLEKVHSVDHIPAHKRHIAATLPDGTVLHNVYIPAGGDIADRDENPKFGDKLDYLDALTRWSNGLKKKEKAIIVGDMNIAPYAHDVWSHKQLLKVVSHTPIEVERMQALREAGGWIDVARDGATAVDMEEKLYSWWSYRSRDYLANNRGRRLDHIWVTPALKNAVSDYHIASEARGWEKPSDHVPVMVKIA